MYQSSSGGGMPTVFTNKVKGAVMTLASRGPLCLRVPVHQKERRSASGSLLRNRDPEADLRSFWWTGTRKHKGPRLAKVITAPFTLLVNTVGIPPPEDDWYIQRETHSFPPHECALSARLNHGSRVLQIRPNALHAFRKQST